MNAPSRKAGSVKRLVVAIGTTSPVWFQCVLEVAHNTVALLRTGIDGNQVIVVQIHAPGPNLCQQMHQSRQASASRAPDRQTDRARCCRPSTGQKLNLSPGCGVRASVMVVSSSQHLVAPQQRDTCDRRLTRARDERWCGHSDLSRHPLRRRDSRTNRNRQEQSSVLHWLWRRERSTHP